MKENKFRVWDVTDERMYYNVTNISDVNGYIMQFTGLYDKNGTEIYEGDIVKYPHIVRFDDIWKVEFSNGSFVIRETIVEISLRELAHKNNLEVIGNIYKNPELMDDANN